jgi:phenylalanyl-tRNA synthetase beta chain
MLWQPLMEMLTGTRIKYQELPRFPEVRRDLALLIDSSVRYEQIRRLAFETERKLLKSVNLFDVYQGKNIPEGKKSYAISYILQDDTKTLTDEQIDKVMKRLIEVYHNELGAQLR